MHVSLFPIVLCTLLIHCCSEALADLDEDKSDSEGLIAMVRSVTKTVPANLSVGPFNIDTRNYANTLLNLGRAMFIDLLFIN